MRLNKEVSNFSASCEHLICEAETSGRKLTEEETLLIEYYCREVLKKVVKRPPSQQQSSGTNQGPSNIPPSDPKNRTAALKTGLQWLWFRFLQDAYTTVGSFEETPALERPVGRTQFDPYAPS